MANKSEENLPKIGYVYHFPKIDEPTDKFRLDIFISSIPTEKHFDVLNLYIFVKAQNGEIKHETISHPWDDETSVNICAGVVIMEDRKGKKEEAFTFGGKMEIEEQEMQTICILKSAAPILEISAATPMHRLFIEELEILLAKLQAKYPDHNQYDRQLCEADPAELYQACLMELIQKFENFPNKNEKYFQLLMHLHSQEHRLKEAGLFEIPAPSLDKIFDE
jgi:hypothetical protein